MTSINNYYRGADLTLKGGVYYVSMKKKLKFGPKNKCKFIEKDSIYEGNQAIFGGAIYIFAENVEEYMNIINSRFRNNRAVEGGAIMSVVESER